LNGPAGGGRMCGGGGGHTRGRTRGKTGRVQRNAACASSPCVPRCHFLPPDHNGNTVTTIHMDTEGWNRTPTTQVQWADRVHQDGYHPVCTKGRGTKRNSPSHLKPTFRVQYSQATRDLGHTSATWAGWAVAFTVLPHSQVTTRSGHTWHTGRGWTSGGVVKGTGGKGNQCKKKTEQDPNKVAQRAKKAEPRPPTHRYVRVVIARCAPAYRVVYFLSRGALGQHLLAQPTVGVQGQLLLVQGGATGGARDLQQQRVWRELRLARVHECTTPTI
jgi:hypothetical protein